MVMVEALKHRLNRGLGKAFCALAPQATNPLVVYSGASSPNVVAHYADTEIWAGGCPC